MERPSAELRCSSSQHGRGSHEEVSSWSSPQVDGSPGAGTSLMLIKCAVTQCCVKVSSLLCAVIYETGAETSSSICKNRICVVSLEVHIGVNTCIHLQFSGLHSRAVLLILAVFALSASLCYRMLCVVLCRYAFTSLSSVLRLYWMYVWILRLFVSTLKLHTFVCACGADITQL